MIAEAPAAQISSEIGHGHASSQMPAGAFANQVSTLQACGDRINRAIAHGSDEELAAANRWCATELDSLQHSRAGEAETPLEFRERIIRCYEGQLAGVVARLECSSVTTIRKLRTEGGRDARHGHEL